LTSPARRVNSRWQLLNFAHVLFVLNRIAEPQFGGETSLPNCGPAVRISANRT